jgi:uncharacterized membrane protein
VIIGRKTDRDVVIRDIRSRLAAAGARMRPMTDLAAIALVLEHVGDPDVVVDAVLMERRPDWLKELIGDDLHLQSKPTTGRTA